MEICRGFSQTVCAAQGGGVDDEDEAGERGSGQGAEGMVAQLAVAGGVDEVELALGFGRGVVGAAVFGGGGSDVAREGAGYGGGGLGSVGWCCVAALELGSVSLGYSWKELVKLTRV